MKELGRRLLNFLVALDQFLHVVLTLGNAAPDETISAAAWRMEQENKWQGRLLRPVIDFLFLPIEKDHCYKAWLAEINGTQRYKRWK